MIPKIDKSRSGIVATQEALIRMDQVHHVAYERLAKTQTTLVDGHNATIDKLAELEGRLSRLPFLSTQASG